jgi:hypothetical protein
MFEAWFMQKGASRMTHRRTGSQSPYILLEIIRELRFGLRQILVQIDSAMWEKINQDSWRVLVLIPNYSCTVTHASTSCILQGVLIAFISIRFGKGKYSQQIRTFVSRSIYFKHAWRFSQNLMFLLRHIYKTKGENFLHTYCISISGQGQIMDTPLKLSFLCIFRCRPWKYKHYRLFSKYTKPYLR